jgi:hypothetical protein
MATRNIVPRANGEGGIGTAAKHWGAGYFDNVNLNGGDLGSYLAESTGYGIVSGCTPSISGLTVTVGAGVVHLSDGTRKEIAETNITLDNADSTNPRIDFVYITSVGELAKITGTAATSPSVPTLPSGGISVCNVSVAAGATTGTVTDSRGVLPRFYNTGIVNVTDFGAVGDGVIDDTQAIQAAFNAGGYILFDRDKTYFVTEELHPKSNSIINLNGSTLTYTPKNLIDNCIKIVGENIYLLNGSIIPKNVTFNSALGDGGNFMPICLGAYGGLEASSDGRQWDDEAKHVVIENMTIYGRFNVETGINMNGNVHDICIRNCGFIAGQTSAEQMTCGIMIHWGGDHVSQRDGTQGTPPTITLHPHNIEISNCRFENVGYLQTNSGNAHCIYLSAVYNISIRNCEFDNVMTGVVVSPGDNGYQFGANNESASGIDITNCSGRRIKGHGIRIQGKPTFYDYYEPMGVNVTNCKFVGTGTSQLSTGNDFGVLIGQLPPYSGENNIPKISVNVENFYSGIRIDNASAIINGSTIYNSRSHGIALESVTGALLRGCAVDKSSNDATIGSREEIKITDSEKINITECFVGSQVQDNCAFGIYLIKSIKCIITNNTFGNFDELNGFAIYVNKSTYADYETHNIVENNTFISPDSLHKIGGDKTFTTNIQNVSYGSTAPTTGSWRAGDRVYAQGPGNAGVGCVGWVCITSGTPGTWKKFGLLE